MVPESFSVTQGPKVVPESFSVTQGPKVVPGPGRNRFRSESFSVTRNAPKVVPESFSVTRNAGSKSGSGKLFRNAGSNTNGRLDLVKFSNSNAAST